MKTIRVLFDDTSKNYNTSVAVGSTDESINEYLVGAIFNLGYSEFDYELDREIEIDDLHVCVGFNWIDENEE